VALDVERGLVTVEAGIQWPELLAGLDRLQTGRDSRWGIVQKQTGADRLTLGGALACNAHGRGLTLPPIIGQVEAFDLVDGSGNLRHCSRTEHPELFRLAIGGYGLFGVVARVQLRLRPRVKVRRVVRLVRTEQVIDLLEERIRDGYEYGDFQFMTDERAGDDFLGLGICACYQPVPDATLMTVRPIGFSAADWARLATLAHTDKRRAFDEYATRYLETCGQIYWSDAQMSSPYADDYHAEIDRACGATVAGSEMIGEIFVARRELAAFMTNARRELRRPSRERDLRHRASDRTRRRVVPGVGEGPVCVRGVQPARGSHARRHRTGFRCVSRADRSRARTRRRVLSHVPPLGVARSGRARVPGNAPVPGAQAPPRSRRAVSKHMVPPLRGDVRTPMKDPSTFATALWIFTVLLVPACRRSARRRVARAGVAPPMAQWQSGLVRYPVLVFWQIVVLLLMTWTASDFARRTGFWMSPPAGMGTTAMILGGIYFAGMIVRYVVRMARRPDQRWFGGTIPIIFHSVVAAFLWTFGMYHAG
jgi:hypothetical protein